MQEAVPFGEGAMAAVLKADRTLVERICAEVPGLVEAVNYNTPQQIVIAGESAAVSEAGAKLKAAGARASTLPVSAPFHSTLMEPAEARLREEALLQEMGLTLEHLGKWKRVAPGTRRFVRVPVQKIGVTVSDNTVNLEFTLPAGSYATILVREILKRDAQPPKTG